MKKATQASLRGQSLVEWALILPALLLVLMVIIDLGRVTYTYSALFNSVREGARYAIIHPTDTTGINATIRHMAVGLDPALITIVTTQPTTRTIQILATYRFAVVTPFASTFLGSNTVTLRTQTTMRTEQ
jgi:Flp pilus assembly protein TadG